MWFYERLDADLAWLSLPDRRQYKIIKTGDVFVLEWSPETMTDKHQREALGFTERAKCECCQQCWRRPDHSTSAAHDVCYYGGPYRGYVEVNGGIYSSIEEAGLDKMIGNTCQSDMDLAESSELDVVPTQEALPILDIEDGARLGNTTEFSEDLSSKPRRLVI